MCPNKAKLFFVSIMLSFKPYEIDLYTPLPTIPGPDLLLLIFNQNMIPSTASFGLQTSFSYKSVSGHQNKQRGPGSISLSLGTNQQASSQ